MTFLGIDPGTRRIGYGVVRDQEGLNDLRLVTAGILTIKSPDDAGALVEAGREIGSLIKRYKPDAIAIEKLYFAKNQKTAIAVAQARGVILLAAKESGARIWEFTPNEVKSSIAGYGFADKKAVLKMVRLILREPALKVIDDASDALALAILAGNRRY